MVAGNVQSKSLHVRLKLRYVLQCSKPQYGTPAHLDRFPLGDIAASATRLQQAAQSHTLKLSAIAKAAFHMLNVNTPLDKPRHAKDSWSRSREGS
jgi:hypothetical protein